MSLGWHLLELSQELPPTMIEKAGSTAAEFCDLCGANLMTRLDINADKRYQ
jgi:hypothetical protein